MKTPLQKLRTSLTRDEQIVMCYKAGNTIMQIAKAFEMTKQNVFRILRAAGCRRDSNPKTRSQQLYAFIGLKLPASVKDAIEIEAHRQKKTVSAYLRQLVNDDLLLDLGDD